MTEKKTYSGQTDTLRRRAEDVFRENAAGIPENLEALSPDEVRQTLHELRVHQIELEMQNEELRLTQGELEASRVRYFDLYDLAPVGYFTLNEQGLILEANLTAATLLGVARSTLVKKPLPRFILPEDQDIFYRHRKLLFETHSTSSGQAGAPQVYELRLVKNAAAPCWVRIDATAAQDADGAPVCRATMSDITDRKLMEAALRDSLSEKEVLLREVHHRVKNNLAAIGGLIQMQRQAAMNAATVTVLTDLDARIRSIAIIHEMFYQAENLARIDFHDYLDTLISHVRTSFGPRSDVRFRVAAKGVEMVLDDAVPCGLLVNELITNAINYAFPETFSGSGAGGREISVTAECDDGAYTLAVADNGVGLPADMEWTTTNTLGLHLVRMLGQHQLGGRIELDRAGGTRFTLKFQSRHRR